MGSDMQELVDYFNSWRTKCHCMDYDIAYTIYVEDVDELLREAGILRDEVLKRLNTNRPDFLGD